MVFDGPINGTAFVAWIEQCLAPELKPGDIVVMDNLGSHKVAGVRQAIKARGAQVRYLPPSSIDARHRARQHSSVPVLAELQAWLQKTQPLGHAQECTRHGGVAGALTLNPQRRQEEL